jgi:hypothetical protein
MAKRLKKDSDVQLIELVRNYPQLYDKANNEYKQQVKKTPIWEDIAKQTGFPGLYLSFILLWYGFTIHFIKDGEKASSRWRNIRTCFVNSKKPKPSGSDGEYIYCYIYSAELNFLIPCLEERPGFFNAFILNYKHNNCSHTSSLEVSENKENTGIAIEEDLEHLLDVDVGNYDYVCNSSSTLLSPSSSGLILYF